MEIISNQYRRVELPDAPMAELDLGCGSGGFAVELASLHPERLVVAADIMLGRLRKLERKLERRGIRNILMLRVEARHLVGFMLGDAVFDRVHILCPDPWPKGRHRFRRLLCSEFLGGIARILKPGGVFHFSSDDHLYAATVEKLAGRSGIFSADLAAIADIAGIESDFERRWLGRGLPVRHLAWRKNRE